MAEDILVKKLKNGAQKGRDTELDESIKSRLFSGFYDARRKEFELKNLSENEIYFLFTKFRGTRETRPILAMEV